ncbi:MAG TPA: hypothetical protein VFP34_11355 [Microlunatus sp.]|nr:hypothetical protein [Microlunatus sp.]
MLHTETPSPRRMLVVLGGRSVSRNPTGVTLAPGFDSRGATPTPPGSPTPSAPTNSALLFTWLKTQGIDDALIQPYSGHESRQSLEIYSRLALADAQQRYNEAITRFPV